MNTGSDTSGPVAVTAGPRFHFFGYYDKTPWSADGRRLLALEAGFMDRRPRPDDVADIGIVHLADANRWEKIAQTRAWNWQQGCMLQWLPGSADEAIFNTREHGRFVAVVQNVRTGARRTLPAPVYGVSPTGRQAISLSFSRLFDVRPGYGYAGVPDPWNNQLCPEEDGLYRVDITTGDTRLILSLGEASRLGTRQPGMDTGKHRFNHAQWNTDGSRFAVLHRWGVGEGGTRWRSRLLTMNADGGAPRVLYDGTTFSHYDWRDPHTILGWAGREGIGDRYFLFTDADGMEEPRVIGEGVLTVDGHCSYSPDRRWLLTDTYPDSEGNKTLILFDPATERRVDIGRFHGPFPADHEIRCDLHPRWSRDGRQICIDSVHESGRRQVYVIDVADIAAAHP